MLPRTRCNCENHTSLTFLVSLLLIAEGVVIGLLISGIDINQSNNLASVVMSFCNGVFASAYYFIELLGLFLRMLIDNGVFAGVVAGVITGAWGVLSAHKYSDFYRVKSIISNSWSRVHPFNSPDPVYFPQWDELGSAKSSINSARLKFFEAGMNGCSRKCMDISNLIPTSLVMDKQYYAEIHAKVSDEISGLSPEYRAVVFWWIKGSYPWG